MGLNMPAKTVVFTSVKKWDGDSHRYIGSGEYIQVSIITPLTQTFVLWVLPSVFLIVGIVICFVIDEWKSWASWQG